MSSEQGEQCSETWRARNDGYADSSSSSYASRHFDVHPSFCKEANNFADVLVRVEGVEFYVHKPVLLFSSSFFASVLKGTWKETQTTNNDSSNGFSMPLPKLVESAPPAQVEVAPSVVSETSKFEHTENDAPDDLQSPEIFARIELHEESAWAFHDFLFFIYPHLTLSVDWCNCDSLLGFADKFEVQYLGRDCKAFIQANMHSRPIEAMRLAEKHEMEDVYEDASRLLFEELSNWKVDGLKCLSLSTQLKLERKKVWYLEAFNLLTRCEVQVASRCSHHYAGDCALEMIGNWKSAVKALAGGPLCPSDLTEMLTKHLQNILDKESKKGSCGSSAESLFRSHLTKVFGDYITWECKILMSIRLHDFPHEEEAQVAPTFTFQTIV